MSTACMDDKPLISTKKKEKSLATQEKYLDFSNGAMPVQDFPKLEGMIKEQLMKFSKYLTLMTSSTLPVSQWYPSLSLK